MSNQPQAEQIDRLKLELENLSRTNEKLAIEIQTLKATSPTSAWEGRISRFIPVLSAIIAVAGFWFGIIQYFRAEDAAAAQRKDTEDKALAQRKEADKTLRLELKRETARPLWATQLELYVDAAEQAATIATTNDPVKRKDAVARFWILYWGPLAAVEDVGLTKSPAAKIEAAMVQFGELLIADPEGGNSQKMKHASLNLAHAIRDALAPAFDVENADLKNLRTDPMHASKDVKLDTAKPTKLWPNSAKPTGD